MTMSHDAHVESAERRPTARARVLTFLQEANGWTPGWKLQEVGGTEATRRVRELCSEKYGSHDITCALIDGAWCYRLNLPRA